MVPKDIVTATLTASAVVCTFGFVKSIVDYVKIKKERRAINAMNTMAMVVKEAYNAVDKLPVKETKDNQTKDNQKD